MKRDEVYLWVTDSKARIAAAGVSVLMTLLIIVEILHLITTKKQWKWGLFDELGFYALFIIHFLIMTFMIFGRRPAYKLMIVFSSLDAVLATYLKMKIVGILFPLACLCLLAYVIGRPKAKASSGFEVIMKKQEKK